MQHCTKRQYQVPVLQLAHLQRDQYYRFRHVQQVEIACKPMPLPDEQRSEFVTIGHAWGRPVWNESRLAAEQSPQSLIANCICCRVLFAQKALCGHAE